VQAVWCLCLLYVSLEVSGGAGAVIDCCWAESLYHDESSDSVYGPGDKGNRAEIDGKCWSGKAHRFLADGGEGRCFEPLWWLAGRYLLLVIDTADAELVVHSLRLRQTRYPLEDSSTFEAAVPALQRAWPVMVRALQMCAHETYMDCPHYEQLMYVGDTRLECLATYAISADARLPAKALQTFAANRHANGLVPSRAPSRDPQSIPPFALWWIGMLRDFVFWRDEPALVRALLPTMRGVLDAFTGWLDGDGLLQRPPGWNFVDWVPGWKGGVPDDRGHGIVATVQWQLVLAAEDAAVVEEACGDAAAGERWRKLAARAVAAAERFYVSARGLYAEDLDHHGFSQHANVLACLSDSLPAERRQAVGDELFAADDLAETTIYFSHYFLEAAWRQGRTAAFFKRLEPWAELVDRGLTTTPEKPEPTRSDCHAWGAHPLYHAFAGVLGLRPAAPGFAALHLAPMLGDLAEAAGSLPHPHGRITVRYRRSDTAIEAVVTAPPSVRITTAEGVGTVKS
jgi:hypothetical protein